MASTASNDESALAQVAAATATTEDGSDGGGDGSSSNSSAKASEASRVTVTVSGASLGIRVDDSLTVIRVTADSETGKG